MDDHFTASTEAFLPNKRKEEPLSGLASTQNTLPQSDTAELVALRKQLYELKERYRLALTPIKIRVWEYDIQTKTICYDAELGDGTQEGQSKVIEHVPESLIESGFIFPESVQDSNALYAKIEQGAEAASCLIKMRTGTDEHWWGKVSYRTVFNQNQTPVRAVGVVEDVTVQTEAEQRYLQELQYREAVIPDRIVSYKINLSKGSIENACCGEGWEEERSNAQTIKELFDDCISRTIHEDEQQKLATMLEYRALLHSYREGSFSLNVDYQRADAKGRILWVSMTVNLIREPSSGDLIGFFYLRDIDEKKKLELSLLVQAQRDEMTGLYNKETTSAMINELLSRARPGARCALLMLNLDNFKWVNDEYGHLYGDRILAALGQLLKSYFQSKYIVGRIGGDEFVVFFAEILSEHWVEARAFDFCKKVEALHSLSEQRTQISASLGITFADAQEVQFKDLLKQASAAVMTAKKQGKNRCAVYAEKGNKKDLTTLNGGCIAKDFFHRQCMMDELDAYVVVIDLESYELLYLNRAARARFLGERQDGIGKKCYELLQGHTSPCPFCNRRDLRWDAFQSWEQVNPTINRRCLVRDKLMMWVDRPARLELFTDISVPSMGREPLSDQEKVERILLDCTSALLAAGSLEQAANLVLKNIGEFYRADRAYIMELDLVQNRGQDSFEWCVAGVVPRKRRAQNFSMQDFPRWMAAFRENRPVMIEELGALEESEPKEYELLSAQNIHAIYAVPFVMQGVPAGYIGVDNPTEHLGDLSLIDSLSYFVMSEMSKRRLQKRQEFLIYHDALTGLCNRSSYLEYRNHVPESVISSMGVLSADINGLKKLNENFGHAYGDHIVCLTAELLRRYFDAKGVYRFSGDEFVVFAQDITHDSFICQIQAMRADLKHQEIGSGICFGYTWADNDISIDRMMNHADELLVLSKQEYYAKSEGVRKHYRPNIVREVIDSVKNGEFEMYLQAKASFETGRLVGAEALVRYRHPRRGVISPDHFIPLLEQESLIRHVDLFIFEEVCKTLERWQKKGYPLFPISLNFSRVTLLEEDLMTEVETIYQKYQIPRDLLEIEITETIGEMERETIAEIGAGIMRQGFRVSLDDFGSKYTSISILSIMEFNVLKLDRSMVSNIVTSKKSQAVARHVIELCREIGAESVAEGVETKEQMEVLKALGCDTAQGYYFSKPIPLDFFEERYFESDRRFSFAG